MPRRLLTINCRKIQYRNANRSPITRVYITQSYGQAHWRLIVCYERYTLLKKKTKNSKHLIQLFISAEKPHKVLRSGEYINKSVTVCSCHQLLVVAQKSMLRKHNINSNAFLATFLAALRVTKPTSIIKTMVQRPKALISRSCAFIQQGIKRK